MKYQTYQAYKDSGVEWLGQVPKHWEIKKSKHLFRIETGGTPLTSNDENFDENGIAWVKPDNLNEFIPIIFTQKYVSKAGIVGIPIIPKGSILVCGIGTVGKFGIAGTNLITNQQINSFIPNFELIDQEFAKYLIASSSEQLAVTANKVVVAISNKTSMQNISLCIPVKTEQQKIAQFLDHETAKIDTLIEKQQRLIELLKEKRQAVISHAVTKGLNPNAPMKDSGVEWLGEVPEHWAVAKLSYRYDVLLGKMLDDKKITGNHLGAYIRNTDVQWDYINDENLPEMDFKPEEQDRYSVKKGDLVVCEGGEIGLAAIWEKETSCFYQKALHRLRPVSSIKDETRFMFR
jgi:type I restriction enzyme S subunit